MPVDFSCIGETSMLIFLVTPKHKISVDVDCFDKVSKLKDHIELRFGIKREIQKLLFNSKEIIDESKTLDDYGIQFNSEIYIGTKENSKL
jgi:hypothetical protein